MAERRQYVNKNHGKPQKTLKNNSGSLNVIDVRGLQP